MLGAPVNVIPERLGHAIVEMVAARAGCEVLQPLTDYTSVDASIKPISGTPGIQIDVQIKASSNLNRNRSHVKFPLKIKNYDDLRDDNLIIPRMLVVADLAELEKDWLSFSKEEVVFKRSVYWFDLHALPATPNTTSVTLDIPKANILTADRLSTLMMAGFTNAKSGKGGLS